MDSISKTNLDLVMLEALSEGNIPKVRNILENLSNANDFLTAVAVLHARSKNDHTIALYNSLFLSFKKMDRGFVNHSIPKGERRIWNEVLIEMSSVLWKWRDNFEPNMWHEVCAKVYEEGLKKLGDGKDESEGGLCDICTRIFSQLLFNFASYARNTDNPIHFYLTEEKVKELSEKIGFSSWKEVTHSNLIEEKIRELSFKN